MKSVLTILIPPRKAYANQISSTTKGAGTYAILPMYSCFEFSQAKVNLDIEDDRPILLAARSFLHLRTTCEW